jgi:hypothetical protein
MKRASLPSEKGKEPVSRSKPSPFLLYLDGGAIGMAYRDTNPKVSRLFRREGGHRWGRGVSQGNVPSPPTPDDRGAGIGSLKRRRKRRKKGRHERKARKTWKEEKEGIEGRL